MSDTVTQVLKDNKAANRKNVFQRIHAVMEEVGTIAKNGKNNFHGYNYATEADFVHTLRPLLVKHGLVVVPQQVTNPSREGDITTIVMMYKIVSIDDPTDFTSVAIPASGQDKGDKGIYKAITGAKKYMMANLFMVATGDDPENDSKDVKPATKNVKAIGGSVTKKAVLEDF